MLETDMLDEKAEGDFLELTPGGLAEFTVTITHDGDGSTISCSDHYIPSLVTGQGASFAQAWFGQRSARI